MMRARSDSCIFNTIALATSHDDKRIAQVAQATEATRNARVTDPSTLTFFILFFTPARPPLDVARFARLQRGRVARRPVARPPLAPLASTMEASAGEDEEPRSVRWPRCLGVAELAKPGLYQARAAFRRASAPPIPRCTPRTTPDAFSRAHAGAAGAAGQRRDADADREGLAPNHEPHGPDEARCAVQPWAAHAQRCRSDAAPQHGCGPQPRGMDGCMCRRPLPPRRCAAVLLGRGQALTGAPAGALQACRCGRA